MKINLRNSMEVRYLIGTMNSADKSITTLDTALRRRFKFVEFSPNLDLLNGMVVFKDEHEIPLAYVLRDLNQRIEYLLDREHQIGHSYFMKVTSWDDLCLCFRDEIIPLLKEYFYGDWEKIALVLGDNPTRGKSTVDKFITQKDLNLQGLFGDEQMAFESNQVYSINEKLASGNFSDLSSNLVVKSFNLK
jgi:5-methylcytosine-specific restriction protein B